MQAFFILLISFSLSFIMFPVVIASKLRYSEKRETDNFDKGNHTTKKYKISTEQREIKKRSGKAQAKRLRDYSEKCNNTTLKSRRVSKICDKIFRKTSSPFRANPVVS